eukprot:241635_1
MSHSDDEDEDDEVGIVIDNGSRQTKAGFAGDDSPRAIFPSIIGKSKYPPAIGGVGLLCGKKIYAGCEAESLSIVKPTYPIVNGIVANWDNMEKLWYYTFYDELRVQPEEHEVLLTEAQLNPRANNTKMIQVLFETFNVPSLYISKPAFLALAALGRSSGVVVDIGDGVSTTTSYEYSDEWPIHCEPKGISRINFAGKDLTRYLAKLLADKAYYFRKSRELEIVRDMKEKLCYCPLNYAHEMHTDIGANYELPDGKVITIDSETIQCPEVLFQPPTDTRSFITPGMWDMETPQQAVYNTIMAASCDNVRKDLCRNIVLCGGTTMLKGFAERLQMEIRNFAETPNNLFSNAKVIAPPNRKYSVWIGGSILASLSTHKDVFVTKNEYDEYGPDIGWRKWTMNSHSNKKKYETDEYENKEEEKKESSPPPSNVNQNEELPNVNKNDDINIENKEKQQEKVNSAKKGTEQNLYGFLKRNKMPNYFGKTVELLTEFTEKDIVHFVRQCKQIKNEMDKFKNEYGIPSELYEKLSKYGIVTIDILCSQIKNTNDMKKYEIK